MEMTILANMFYNQGGLYSLEVFIGRQALYDTYGYNAIDFLNDTVLFSEAVICNDDLKLLVTFPKLFEELDKEIKVQLVISTLIAL